VENPTDHLLNRRLQAACLLACSRFLSACPHPDPRQLCTIAARPVPARDTGNRQEPLAVPPASTCDWSFSVQHPPEPARRGSGGVMQRLSTAPSTRCVHNPAAADQETINRLQAAPAVACSRLPKGFPQHHPRLPGKTCQQLQRKDAAWPQAAQQSTGHSPRLLSKAGKSTALAPGLHVVFADSDYTKRRGAPARHAE
jgi:hypothetical protein